MSKSPLFQILSCVLSAGLAVACISDARKTAAQETASQAALWLSQARSEILYKDPSLAIEKAYDALALVDQLDGTIGDSLAADAHETIAWICLKAYRDSLAWEHACRSEAIARRRGFRQILAKSLLSKAYVCSYSEISEESNRNDEGLHYAQEALSISKVGHFVEEQVEACYVNSQLYVNKNRWNATLHPQWYQLAGDWLDQGEALARDTGREDLLERAITFRIRYFRQGGDLERAKDWCQDALGRCDERNFLARQQLYDHLTVLYGQLGEKEQSVKCHQNYVLTMQQYLRKKADDLALEYDNRYEASLKQKQIERKKIQLLLISLLLLFAMTVMVMVIRSNWKLGQSYQALRGANHGKQLLLAALAPGFSYTEESSSIDQEVKDYIADCFHLDEDGIRARSHALAEGDKFIDSRVVAYICELMISRKRAADSLGLTDREKEILLLSSQGLSAAQIAEKIFVSTRTVSNHKQKIYQKMDVSSNTEMLYKARQLGLL